MRVAGAQIAVTDDVAANERAIHRAIDAAGASGADVLLTPEGSLSGYRHDAPAAEVDPALARVEDHARERGVGLALGICRREADGRTYNELRFYAPDGTFVGFHGKRLLCATRERPGAEELDLYAVAPLRVFGLGGTVVAGLICNDLWASPEYTPMPDPHLAREVVGMGARVIFHAVNGYRDASERGELYRRFHEAAVGVHARAAGAFIVTVDSAHPLDVPTSSPGGVVGPDGRWRVRCPRLGEHVFTYDLEPNGSEDDG